MIEERPPIHHFLKKFAEDNNILTISAMAEFLGFSKNFISLIHQGKSQPTRKFKAQFIKKFKLKGQELDDFEMACNLSRTRFYIHSSNNKVRLLANKLQNSINNKKLTLDQIQKIDEILSDPE